MKGLTFAVGEGYGRAGSIERAQYADSIARRLEKFGLKRVGRDENPQLLVYFSTGIDGGQQHQTAPIYLPGTSGQWIGNNYWPGTPGQIVGGDSYTVFTRRLELQIIDTRNPDGTLNMFEATVTSQGSSPSFLAVSECMFDAVFEGFPGKSGETTSVTAASPNCAK